MYRLDSPSSVACLMAAACMVLFAFAIGSAYAECKYFVGSTHETCPWQGCSGGVDVHARGDYEEMSCGWSTESKVDWIQVGPIHSSGSGTAQYDVKENPYTADRFGTLVIAGYDVVLKQDGRPEAHLDTQPDHLSFTAPFGGPNPPSQKIGIKNGGPQGSQMQWKAGTNATWMQVGPSSGGIERNEMDEVIVNVSPSGMRAGTYEAEIVIVAPGAENSPVKIPVTFTISQMPQALLDTQPEHLNFVATFGGPNPPSQTINIKNGGPQGSQLQWKVDTNAWWMQLGPSSGDITQHNEVDDVTVTVTARDMPAGTYSSEIIIAAPNTQNSPVRIPVTYTVSSASGPQALLDTQPDSLSFVATSGGSNPPSQTINIMNSGPQGSQLQWNVGTNARWMQLGPTSGSITQHNEIDDVTVAVTAKDVPPGSYNATIVIASPDAQDSPVRIPVMYTVRRP